MWRALQPQQAVALVSIANSVLMEALQMENVWLAPMAPSTQCTLEYPLLSTPPPVHTTAAQDTQRRQSTISAAQLAILDLTTLAAPNPALVTAPRVQID